MPKIGLSNLYYALNTKDDATGVTYSIPVKVPGVISADIKTASDTATLYADNGPSETATAMGEVTVDLELKDIPLEVQATWLGHTIANGVMTNKSDDAAPYLAIMFESLKSNGKKRFVKLLKGKFQEPDDNNKTKEEKITFQTQKITGKFVVRDYDREWKRTTDEDATGYVAATGTSWYTSVEPS